MATTLPTDPGGDRNHTADLPPLATQARAAHLAGDGAAARALVARLVADVTGRAVVALRLGDDPYALNSLNGIVTLTGGEELFFKFHSEEGERATIAEYYRAGLLARHGYPVDVPVHANGEPGRQILMYRARTDPRMVEAVAAVDDGTPMRVAGRLLDADVLAAAVVEHQRRVGAVLTETWHPQAGADEPLHQLFWHRLASPDRTGLGGRVRRFYVDRIFRLGDDDGRVELGWSQLSELVWVVNGVQRASLAALFAAADASLDPARLAGGGSGGAVVAHGDEHDANLWVDVGPGAGPTATGGHGAPVRLTAFDPAFAGEHVPALLAQVKALFHNVLAHPRWLYRPAACAARVRVRVDGPYLRVDHDHAVTPVRERVLAAQGEHAWTPLLARSAAAGALPDDWRTTVRLALFACPTLVMDLTAGGPGGHTPTTSALGFALAVAAGSEPADALEGTRGRDLVGDFLDTVDPGASTVPPSRAVS